MAHKDRKIRKKRGSKTCGWGGRKKHRGSGTRGGVGMGGSKKHKWSFVSKYMPNYFGRHGFKRPRKVIKEEKIINLSDLEENFERFLNEGKIIKKDNSYYINLKDLGYDKLLGKGKISKPLIVKVDSYSKKALNKLMEVKGKIESGISQTNT
ncbi:MAG: uL15 family ribosomal protein [Candidatus Altiarchaeota archaeon]